MKAVVKVGGGRGFIIRHRMEYPPSKGKRCFVHERIVITAGHCLPYFPPCFPDSFLGERTYKSLLGTLHAPKLKVWAECLFVDPIGDIAVLGCPDRQDLGEQADAYDALTAEAPALRVGKAARSGSAWLLALNGQWVPCAVELLGNKDLWIGATSKNEAGMSGSPILADDGMAIGVLSVGSESTSREGVRKLEKSGPHPVLAHHLPGWLLRELK